MMPRQVIVAAALLALQLDGAALACSTTAWSGGSSGAVAVNDPDSGVPSVSGRCGLGVTGAGFVQDDAPAGEAVFHGRFYFLPQLAGNGSADLFIAYADAAATPLFTVRYDGAGVTLDATAAGGDSAFVPVSGDRWHLVEFHWASDDAGSLWVDSDARQDPPDAPFSPGSGAVETVRLGAPNGLGGLAGAVYFDDYVSRRQAPVGPILAGDANLDGVVDGSDVDVITARFLFRTYAEGSTDCNLDGDTNSGDVNCAVEQF